MNFLHDLLLAVLRVHLHSLHPPFPPLLELVCWVEYRFLLVFYYTLFVFLNLLENFILRPFPLNFFLKFFHFLFHFSVLAGGYVVDHLKVHLLLITIHVGVEAA